MSTESEKRTAIFRVVSGKGGVGKSFIASTLAYALAARGKRTLFVDLDTGLRNVDLVLGIRDKVVYNMFDVAEKQVPLDIAVVKGIGQEGDMVPHFLFCDNNKTKNAVSMEAVAKMLDDASENYDALVLDSPAGVEYGFKMATSIRANGSVKCCTIIVSTPEMPSLNTAHSIANRLTQMEDSFAEEPVYLVLNRCIPELTSARVNGGITPEDAARQIMVPLLGAVPIDLDIVSCANQGKPIWVYRPKSISRAIISEIAEILVREFYKEDAAEKQNPGADIPAPTENIANDENDAMSEEEDETEDKENYPGKNEYTQAIEEDALGLKEDAEEKEEARTFFGILKKLFGKNRKKDEDEEETPTE